MFRLVVCLASLSLLVACQDPAVMTSALNGESVIYGEDDRFDLYQVTDEVLLTKAKSTVALVQTSKLTPAEEGQFAISATSIGARMNLCPTERFREQDSLAFCSGSLVGKDLILTAGHCATNCASTAFLFDYAVTADGETGPKTISADKVYRCKEVVEFKLEQGFGSDYALLRLDREVTDRKPLSVRREGNLTVGSPLVVIGHPSGMPTKIAGGANVRAIDHRPYFTANLDTYGGNSGSAVFNQVTGEIEGILVRGETDYVDVGTCKQSMRCTNAGCMGEHVTKVGLVVNSIPVVEEDAEVIEDGISSLGFD